MARQVLHKVPSESLAVTELAVNAKMEILEHHVYNVPGFTGPPPLSKTQFTWDRRKARAIEMLASGRWREQQICRELNLSMQTLHSWMHNNDFNEKLAELTHTITEHVIEAGIASKMDRIRAAQDRYLRCQELIEARAEAAGRDSQADPGAETGLLYRVSIPKADDMYLFDAALMKEMRELEKYISAELGQNAPAKLDVTSGGRPILFTIPMADDQPVVLEGEFTVENTVPAGTRQLGSGRGILSGES